MSQLVPYTQDSIELDDALIFTTMFDWKADDKKILTSYDGLNSGVPTRTTATLTPTTLRSIEQTFVDFHRQAEQHSNQAGFVPPSVAPNSLGVSQTIGFAGGSLRVSPGPSSSSGSIDSGPSASPTPSPSAPAPVRRRGMGGRRPANAPIYVSPEEEERRSVRRERNKMAAARCRKRRLDHTNELEDETKDLEKKKQTLQEEIRQLTQNREELEFILETHRACCRMQATRRTNSPPDIKPNFQTIIASEKRNDLIMYPVNGNDVRVKEEVLETPVSLDNDVFTSPQTNKRIMLSSANPQVVAVPSQNMPKPNRPNFLNVPLSLTPSQSHGLKNNSNLSEVAGIAITTPSNGIPFNFESLMEGGTGLTPVQPCATQQQKSQPEIGSPDVMNSSKLEHRIK
ncbi:transcription factor kayak isoform X3 [Arctopsyche grandis]|uniref:transcription factor kayak isoform X3 n=1 Tax=Arctopsyche grandis TaxID=121162 RepID=UPI00406D93F6